MKIKIIIRELLFLIGILLITWFLWIKFLRGRLPKDIPYFITEERFYILIFICLVYLYLIKNIIFPKKNENMVTNKLVEVIYKPFYVVDEKIKEKRFLLKKIISYLDKLALKDVIYKNLVKEYYIFRLIPRLILVLILVIDIFFFKKISFFYKFVILSLLPLLFRLKKFQIKESKKSYINYYEKIIGIENIELNDVRSYDEDEEYEDEEDDEYEPLGIYHNKEISVSEYLDIIDDASLEKNKIEIVEGLKGDKRDKDDLLMPHYCVTVFFRHENYRDYIEINKDKYQFTEEDIEGYNKKKERMLAAKKAWFARDIVNGNCDELKNLREEYDKFDNEFYNDKIILQRNKDFKIIDDNFKMIVIKLQKLKINIINYTMIEDRKDIKLLKLIIYISYLICWSYFLYKSYDTTNNLEITRIIIEKIKNYTKENIDPFSNIIDDF